jgi:NAD(P)-dependent dehydrogenase (short-subunit alcohol dehydrogenase family)
MNSGRCMEGKRVLVTGSGTGIGTGVALEFAREGAAVALHYCHSGKGAHAAVEEIRKAGGKAEAFRADFADVEQAQRLPAAAVAFLGGLDILVNNAGITMNLPFERVTPEQFDALYSVNVRSLFFVTQAAIKPMIEQGYGTIINMTSDHAFSGLAEHTVYAGTKAAIVAFTRTLSVELASKGIRVNAIAPGWILVENHLKVLPADFDEKAAGLARPAGFLGRPHDVGRLAVFLASEDARYIIGQTFICDGGVSALMPATGDFRKPLGVTFGKEYVRGL